MERLCLGTVQLGMRYGVNNAIGRQPTQKESFEILDLALANNIKYLDTAAAYGSAEQILGEYNIAAKNVPITTKLLPNVLDKHPEKKAIDIIEQEVTESLNKLKIKQLDGYLLHTPEYFYNKEVMFALQEIKKSGYVQNIGVSIYEEQHAVDVVKSGLCDYIQIPYSIFDQRVNSTDFFAIAKEQGVKVFARSAFLQGLILMQENTIPRQLSMAIDYLKQLDKIIAKYNFSRLEAGLLFSYQNENIDKVVFGVETTKQLEEDLQIVKEKRDFSACKEELEYSFSGVPKSIIFPSLWKKG